MSGITSPARPWFRLTTPDPALAEFGRVKEYLYQVQNIMTTGFLRSNIYNTLPIVYGDVGGFGTAPFSVEEDMTGSVLHTNSFPVGSYMIAKDYKGRVNTFMREYRMTVRQLVEKFGQLKNGNPDWSNFSDRVKTLWDTNKTEDWVDVVHVITPNSEFDTDKLFSKFKKFTSCYYESANTNSSKEVFLMEKGYDYFPILCSRWETTGEDVYATDCPGFTALGDIKQLQLGEKRALEAIDKMIRPPMIGPTSLQGHESSILPGGTTWVDIREGQQGFRPIFQLDFNLNALEQKQQQVRSRIQRAFYEDLFLMLANSDRRDITATEIAERKEEKLLALGPVLEQLNTDVLDPLIDIAFDLHVRQGLLPPPPEELQGIPLKVEYISVMQQAQKLIGIGSMDRFFSFAGQLARFDQNIMKKVDTEQAIDVYAEMTSVPPSIVRTDEQVEQMKQLENQQIQQQQQMQMVQQGASAAKNLAQADTSGENALTEMLGAVGGS